MNRLRIAVLLALALPLASGCTSFKAYQKAQQDEKFQNWDQAVQEYTRALALDPDNFKYKAGLDHAKLEASRQHFEKGKTLRAAGQNEAAAVELELTTRLDSTNQYAAVEFSKAIASLQEAQRGKDKASLAEMKKRAITKAQPPQLNPASEEPISLSFPHDTPVKDIYKALGSAFGINILFDQAVKDDRISIELRDVTAQQALERVMQAAGHFYKVLDEKTIIVVPDNPQQRRDYEDLVIQTFYLSNGDAEQVTNVVRTMIEARNVFPLKALNAITIRDTADKVRIAQKIIQANDKAKAEVVVDIELLQLDMDRVRDLGAQLGAYAIGQGVVGKDASGNPTVVSSIYTLEALRHLTSNDTAFSIPSVVYNFLKTNTDAEQLANPELRISEGEKATLHIGNKIPVPVASFQSLGGGTANNTYSPVTSFQYQDVGIKVSIEPRVHHNREVTLKLTVEVSDKVGDVNIAGSAPQPIISTRTIESTIRLKDGETNFLAGLIQKNQSKTEDRIPFLGDIPLIGRLFDHEHHTVHRTDLVLTMTPHIIRIPDITEDDLAPMWVGTVSNLTFRGVSPRIESQTNGDPFTAPQLPTTSSPQFQENAGIVPPGTMNIGAPATPTIVVPAGTAPSSVNPPKPQAQLAPITLNGSAAAASPNATASSNSALIVAQGSGPSVPLAFRTATASADTGAADPVQSSTSTSSASEPTAALSPRLGPQPVTLALKSGMEHNWSVIGMDLDGLSAAEVLLHFDPRNIDVLDVAFGSALVVDQNLPPVATINRLSGTVRVANPDGRPLVFQSGGEVVTLRVRALAPGETFLVLEVPTLSSGRQPVGAIIAGGRARVE
jgi:general secretion pathway protein D